MRQRKDLMKEKCDGMDEMSFPVYPPFGQPLTRMAKSKHVLG